MTFSKPASGWIQVGIYIVATAAGVGVAAVAPWEGPLWTAVVASVVATAVVFGAGLWLNNASAYDPYWSVAPPLLATFWSFGAPVEPRQWLALGLMFAWGARLTASFWRGWSGFGHEDWRYRDLRAQTGRFFPAVNLLGIHYFPTVCTFTGSLPFLVMAQGHAPLNWLDAVAAVVAAGAIWIEARADTELHHFKQQSHPPGTILDTGIWAWSRHPNYFGEVSFWWGMALFGQAATPGTTPLWNYSGAVIITVLFLGISLPLIETRMAARRPGWPEHTRRVPLLIPRPPRARSEKSS